MKIRISGIIQSVTSQSETTKAPGESTEKQALSLVDDFLDACCVVSNEVETAAAKLYSDYLAFCESQGSDWVNPTAFAVRIMNRYQGQGVERSEVMSVSQRIEIYRGLALKSKEPPQQSEKTPKPPKAASTDLAKVSERKRKLTEPIPTKDLSHDELIICIRGLESEISSTPVVIDEYWGEIDLRVQLRVLEAQKSYIVRSNRMRIQRDEPPIDWHSLPNRQWVKLTPDEIEYFSVSSADTFEDGESAQCAHRNQNTAASRLLSVWKQRHLNDMLHRNQVIDLAIECQAFASQQGRDAKWEAVWPILKQWEDERLITAWRGGLYQLNLLKANP